MFGFNELFVILSEVILSSYPLLIKLVDASLFTQTGLRMAVYAILGALATVVTGVHTELASVFFTKESAAIGVLNLLHVAASYLGFEQLAGGNAMALFYTYPVWNILGASAILKEPLQTQALPWIGLALLGTIALAQPSTYNWTILGVVAALVAALTESGIYLWFKQRALPSKPESNQPWTKMTQMYGTSGLIWGVLAIFGLGFGILGPKTFAIGSGGLSNILMFNTFVGFVGYSLRFYLIPKVATATFSAISFFGVISAYLLSWLFVNEVPTITQAFGAVAIVIANAVIVTRDTV